MVKDKYKKPNGLCAAPIIGFRFDGRSRVYWLLPLYGIGHNSYANYISIYFQADRLIWGLTCDFGWKLGEKN
jgi:hypothetical protein